MDSLTSFVSITNLPEDPGFATFFYHLLKKRTNTDVIFILETSDGDVELSAHQLVLAMRSYYFADRFFDGEKEEEATIRLKKFDPEVFKRMLKYCYGRTPRIETSEEACDLYKVASEFKVISLMNLCLKYLTDIKIEPKNVFSMLEVSDYMDDQNLKDKCNKLLQTRTREVIACYELHEVTPVMVHTFLDLPKLSLESEYELVKWIFDWAKEKCQEKNSDCGCPREFLQKLLTDMNFLALKFEEFAEICKENADFFTSEEIASVYMNIAFPLSWDMPDWYDRDLQTRVYTGP